MQWGCRRKRRWPGKPKGSQGVDPRSHLQREGRKETFLTDFEGSRVCGAPETTESCWAEIQVGEIDPTYEYWDRSVYDPSNF